MESSASKAEKESFSPATKTYVRFSSSPSSRLCLGSFSSSTALRQKYFLPHLGHFLILFVHTFAMCRSETGMIFGSSSSKDSLEAHCGQIRIPSAWWERETSPNSFPHLGYLCFSFCKPLNIPAHTHPFLVRIIQDIKLIHTRKQSKRWSVSQRDYYASRAVISNNRSLSNGWDRT